ncbi:uncharacterized protein CCOS01_01115 [Colletotrichum costaricense]|uniref:Uncharacterized protein n=1 Tax=Colletotrichum costaricense TaxID=1209916 RepID=A0AAI9ZC24_9PEZI|nr:uncharacterized protein CCOS01_01115 [Colletotrichum costaricense]KAK1539801.1 hypothetical protein CCOS01_01115 [Colletotrichum costaricense]
MFFTGDVRPTTSRHLTTSVSTEPQTTISFPCVLMPRKQRKYVRVNLRPNRARSTLTRPHLNTPLDYAPQFGGKHAHSRYPYGYIHHCHTPRLDKRPHEQYNYRHIMPRQGEAQNLTGRNLVVRQAFTPPLWAEFHTRPTEAIVQPDAASSCQANPTFSASATFAIEQWEPFTGLPVHV